MVEAFGMCSEKNDVAIMNQLQLAMNQLFPDGITDIKFSVRQDGTVEDCICQFLRILQMDIQGLLRPYSDY